MKIPQAYLNASNTTRQYKRNNIKATFDTILNTRAVDSIGRTELVTDAEHDPSLINQLDYATWLPFAAKVYHISPRIEDYILVKTIICPSELPNRNGIAFPTQELARFMPPPISRLAYKAWIGAPVHLEHANEVHEEAYGVVFDASFHKVQGYGGGNLWKVMGLLGIDKTKYSDIAQKIFTKEINTYSMGAMVDQFTCGYCKSECTVDRCCNHITNIRDVNWKHTRALDGSSHLVFLNAHGINPIEVSIVADPAWAPALSDEIFEFNPNP